MKKDKKLEKSGKDRVLGDSAKTVRGAVDAPPRKTKNLRLRRLRSQEHHRNMRLNWNKAERASLGDPQREKPQKQAMTTEVRQETGEVRKQRERKAHQSQPSRPRKPTAPNHAVSQRKGEGKLRLPPDKRRLAKQNALLILTAMEKWFYFCQPKNLAFHDITIDKVAPKALQSLLELGVNFCPTPLRPTLNIDKSMVGFDRDLHIRSVFSGREDLIPLANPKIYIRSK